MEKMKNLIVENFCKKTSRTKMVAFDYEMALLIINKEIDGRIVTREGKDVRIIYMDGFDYHNNTGVKGNPYGDMSSSIVAFIKYENVNEDTNKEIENFEYIVQYNEEGVAIIFSDDFKDDSDRLDLFLDIPEKYLFKRGDVLINNTTSTPFIFNGVYKENNENKFVECGADCVNDFNDKNTTIGAVAAINEEGNIVILPSENGTWSLLNNSYYADDNMKELFFNALKKYDSEKKHEDIKYVVNCIIDEFFSDVTEKNKKKESVKDRVSKVKSTKNEMISSGYKFETFEKVLVRTEVHTGLNGLLNKDAVKKEKRGYIVDDNNGVILIPDIKNRWKIDFWMCKCKNGVYNKCLSGVWKECIPYKGNEHLIVEEEW